MIDPGDGVELRETQDGIELTVKVVPGASRTRVLGTLGTALKLAVSEPPEGGKANGAVVRLLARMLDVKKGAVTIVSGHAQPLKRVVIAGLSMSEVRQRLMSAH